MTNRIWGLLIVKGLNDDGTEWENQHECFMDEALETAGNYPHKLTYIEFKHHKI